MQPGHVDPAIGERIRTRLERKGGTKRDRFLLEDLQARSLAIACDLDHCEDVRLAAQFMAAQFALLLSRAEAIRQARRAARTARRPRIILGKIPLARRVRAAAQRRRSAATVGVGTSARAGPSGESGGEGEPPDLPLRAGVSVGLITRICWLKEQARNEFDTMCDYLSIGADLGGITILTMRDLAAMDKFEAELRGEAWHALTIIANSITDEQRREWCSLMWFGRGDGNLAYCCQHTVNFDHNIVYVFRNPIDNYLTAALRRLGLVCDDAGEA